MSSREPLPQTVEALQELMAKDAVLMEEQDKEITRLKVANQKLRDKLAKCRKERL